MSMSDVRAGDSFIRRWQRQCHLRKLEEQAKEAAVNAQLDDLEQVRAALTVRDAGHGDTPFSTFS
jgi:hypothetical protein